VAANDLHPERFLDIYCDVDNLWMSGVQMLNENNHSGACYYFMIFYYLTGKYDKDEMMPMYVAAEKCFRGHAPDANLKFQTWEVALLIITHKGMGVFDNVEAHGVPDEPARGSTWHEFDNQTVGFAMCYLFAARLLCRKLRGDAPRFHLKSNKRPESACTSMSPNCCTTSIVRSL